MVADAQELSCLTHYPAFYHYYHLHNYTPATFILINAVLATNRHLNTTSGSRMNSGYTLDGTAPRKSYAVKLEQESSTESNSCKMYGLYYCIRVGSRGFGRYGVHARLASASCIRGGRFFRFFTSYQTHQVIFLLILNLFIQSRLGYPCLTGYPEGIFGVALHDTLHNPPMIGGYDVYT